jgi:hypothetical protein
MNSDVTMMAAYIDDTLFMMKQYGNEQEQCDHHSSHYLPVHEIFRRLNAFDNISIKKVLHMMGISHE